MLLMSICPSSSDTQPRSEAKSFIVENRVARRHNQRLSIWKNYRYCFAMHHTFYAKLDESLLPWNSFLIKFEHGIVTRPASWNLQLIVAPYFLHLPLSANLEPRIQQTDSNNSLILQIFQNIRKSMAALLSRARLQELHSL